MVINKKRYADLVYCGSNLSRGSVVGGDALSNNMRNAIKRYLLTRMYGAISINDSHPTNGRVCLLQSFSRLRLLRFANRVGAYWA